MFDIDDVMYDDYIPILDDECDEYLDAKCDELACECESTVGAMLDAEIENLQEQGILNEACEFIDSDGNATKYNCDDDDEDDDDDDEDDIHYYISDDDEDDESEEDEVIGDPSDNYVAIQDIEVDKQEET